MALPMEPDKPSTATGMARRTLSLQEMQASPLEGGGHVGYARRGSATLDGFKPDMGRAPMDPFGSTMPLAHAMPLGDMPLECPPAQLTRTARTTDASLASPAMPFAPAMPLGVPLDLPSLESPALLGAPAMLTHALDELSAEDLVAEIAGDELLGLLDDTAPAAAPPLAPAQEAVPAVEVVPALEVVAM